MKKSGVVLGMALLAASVAQADNGFYVLGAAGLSRVDDFISRDDLEDSIGLPVDSFSRDRSDFAYKAQVGYQFTDYFAIEGGYVDLGKVSAKGSGQFFGLSYRDQLDWEAKGFNVAGLLTLPVNAGWSLFFKLGAIRADVDAKEKASVSFGSTSASSSWSYDDTSVKANFGLGVKWEFIEHVGVRAEIERFNKLGDADETGESSVDLFTLGAYYQF
jgi:OOP family OmpA-OmpF porin